MGPRKGSSIKYKAHYNKCHWLNLLFSIHTHVPNGATILLKYVHADVYVHMYTQESQGTMTHRCLHSSSFIGVRLIPPHSSDWFRNGHMTQLRHEKQFTGISGKIPACSSKELQEETFCSLWITDRSMRPRTASAFLEPH